jgi:hypothetical protein
MKWQDEMFHKFIRFTHLSRTGKSEIRIPACQRLRQHSAYVPTPACLRQVHRAGQMLAFLAMAGRSLSMAGRSKHETNSNDRNINNQNGKRYHQTAFVLNFEHLNFDIVSDLRLTP